MNIDDLIDNTRYDLHWQMTRWERLAMERVLIALSPALSIEIGTHMGGSLQVIAECSERVVSLDLDPDLKTELGERFPNVEFVAGRSQQTLPGIIENLNAKGLSPEFVLVDGDHSEDGVRDDVNLLLQLRPRQAMVILMHDSFNPACRRGMLTASWEECPYVHQVDLDFLPGLYSAGSYDTAEAGSMWSGLGCAVLLPEHRAGELTIERSQQAVFEVVEPISVHHTPRAPASQWKLPAWLFSLLE